MTMKSLLVAAAAVLTLTLPATAQDAVQINDAYARASAASGAVFFQIENHQTDDDRLIAVASDAAERVELHTHKEDANGVMQMLHVPEGFAVPANASHALARGGDHVMLMGLKAPLKTGDVINLTLTFEKAGEVVLQVPVDNERTGAAMGHGMGQGMGGAMDHSGHAMPAPTN